MHLRFSIRDLLWLTALVALAVGWYLDHRRLADVSRSHYTAWYLKYADCTVAQRILQTTFAGTPGVRISADPKINAIFTSSSGSQEAEILDILSKLDQNPH